MKIWLMLPADSWHCSEIRQRVNQRVSKMFTLPPIFLKNISNSQRLRYFFYYCSLLLCLVVLLPIAIWVFIAVYTAPRMELQTRAYSNYQLVSNNCDIRLNNYRGSV